MPQEKREWAGELAEAAEGRELAPLHGLRALPAGERGRVEQQERVVRAGQLAGDRPPEEDELGRELPAALVVGRLARQSGKRCPSRPAAIGRKRRSLGMPSSICATIRQMSSLSLIASGRPRRRLGSGDAGKSEQAAQSTAITRVSRSARTLASWSTVW